MKQLIANYQIQKSEIDEARALYRKEAQKRKLLYNEVYSVLQYDYIYQYTNYLTDTRVEG